MPYLLRHVLQQAQRKIVAFAFGLFREIVQQRLHVCADRRAYKFNFSQRAVSMHTHRNVTRRVILGPLGQHYECLLNDQRELVAIAPGPAGIERVTLDEMLDVFEGVGAHGETRLVHARCFQRDQPGKQNRGDAARGHAVIEHLVKTGAHLGLENLLVLKAHANPERQSEDDAIVKIHALGEHEPNAVREQQHEQDDDIDTYDGLGNTLEQSRQLGAERQQA